MMFIMPYEVFQLLRMWMKSLSVAIQTKAIDRYFLVVLFYYAINGSSNIESVDENRKV